MTPVVNCFVGVDWSGATGSAYSGIAVAECPRGTDPPVLVRPPGRRWRRADFVDWVTARAGQGERLLIGIDCAFALPAAMAGPILGDSYSVSALWAHIDGICADVEDYYGGAFAEHHAHAPLFWRSGPRPAGFAEHHRATEQACRAAGFGAPESPLKLVGARQVGKGGLAGMRVLHALKQRLGDDFAVWPFDPSESASIVCVELYPRLFMRMAGHGNTKVRTPDALNRCFAALATSSYPKNHETFSDHESDALVAAAGLRFIADDRAVWSPSGLDSLAVRAEGWIFGVT
ncbi:MAG: hypothetical protein JWM91_1074 [Rhodospirillales bacterium]|nr:hypothetical protein [Rhodospirillales bacterium]